MGKERVAASPASEIKSLRSEVRRLQETVGTLTLLERMDQLAARLAKLEAQKN